jgi:FtsZ-interacting cell division protein ZipA
MDTLRWILLIFGLVLIAAVYFVGRRKGPDPFHRKEPELDSGNRFDRAADEDEYAADGGFEARDIDSSETDEDSFNFERMLADVNDTGTLPPPKPRGKETGHSMLLEDEFVVIHLMVAAVSSLSGSRLYSGLQELGFELEEDEIFHYRESDCPLIVVNMFKPGTFPEDPGDLASKGISFILRLSRTDHPLDSFDEMIALAYELKSLLNLQLFDMHRSSLTKQTIAFLEEEVGEYQRRRGV